MLASGADLYGNLSDDALESELRRIRASPIRGNANYLDPESKGFYFDHYSDSDLTHGFFAFYHPTRPTYTSKNSALGFLIPYHGIALIFDQDKTRSLNAEYRDHLKELGYTFCDWERSKKTDRTWSLSNKLWLLRETRKKGLDQRAVEIIQKLGENLDLEGTTLRFAKFEIGEKTFTDADYGRVDVHQTHIPGETFLDLPFNTCIEELNRVYSELPLMSAIGLTSVVTRGDRTYHIPMMDKDESWLHPKDLHKVSLSGMAVSSGRGQHFYGFRLLEEREYAEYLESLREIYGIDSDWEEDQKRQGFMMLRLTPSRHRLYQPCFDEILHPEAEVNDLPPDGGYY